jgi:hypothetical protein
MQTKYQIVIIGSDNRFLPDIKHSIYKHIDELGLVVDDSILFITEINFNEYRANAPTFCLYFGDNDSSFKNIDIVETLKANATLIIPIYNSDKSFHDQIPEQLRNNNGFRLDTVLEVESIVGCLLEGLGLLRTTRRLFISYKRNESTSVAIQLYEQLESKGFDVFLDTHSIRPGEPFQEELWHRMTDTDVIVMLNTHDFLTSKWCAEELAEANAKSIGILNLVWPENTLINSAQLSIPYSLSENDFTKNIFKDPYGSFLTDDAVNKIVNLTESLRARCLASRQNNLITEFISAAKKLKIEVTLQPERIIIQERPNGKERVFIPAVGIPQSLTYNQSEELIDRIRKDKVDEIFLLFDHRSIRDKWLNHLYWLDKYLKIKSTTIVGIEEWLQKN